MVQITSLAMKASYFLLFLYHLLKTLYIVKTTSLQLLEPLQLLDRQEYIHSPYLEHRLVKICNPPSYIKSQPNST